MYTKAEEKLISMGYKIAFKTKMGEGLFYMCSKGRKDVWFEAIGDTVKIREDIEPLTRPT